MKEDKFKSKAPISVVIPCYCCQDTIKRAVKSVAEQTWNPAEVILVDDSSIDRTPEILYELANYYDKSWIKVILREKNGGPGATRNTGWDAVTQPYIAFIDADDSWHPQKIEIQLTYMLSRPEIVITGHRIQCLKKEIPMPLLSKHYKTKTVSKRHMLLKNMLGTSTVMLNSKLKFRFNPSKCYGEDYLLWLEILFNEYEAIHIDMVLAFRYKGPYGEGGLSGQLWEMEKKELYNYKKLRNERLISWPTFVGLGAFSMVKYARRVVISKLRTMRREP